MDGILNILKPPGMTSFDVVAYLRGVLKTKKIGHTGTLDPGAAGVLPICIGTATKAIEYITDTDKLYRAEMTLGVSTDTQDSYGEITSIRTVKLTDDKIKEAIESFVGKYEQIPPMYSAIKVNGKRLYELARQGLEVKRKPRSVEIYSIDVIDIKNIIKETPAGLNKTTKVIFDVVCSKGTYIRTLCHDIGEKLGCGGHMSFLVRTGAGIFRISSAVTLEDVKTIANDGRLGSILVETDKVFLNFEKVVLDKDIEKKFLNGVFISYNIKGFIPGSLLRVYNTKKNFIALGEIVDRKGRLFLKSKKRF